MSDGQHPALRADGTVDVVTLRELVATKPPEYVVNSREDLLGLAEMARKRRDVVNLRETLRASRIVEWEMSRRWPANPNGAARADDRPALTAGRAADSVTWQRVYAVGRAPLERILSATDIEDLSQRAFRTDVRADKSDAPGTPRRKPLPQQASDAAWSLRKAVERLERIFVDDRFIANKEQVAAHTRGHLTYAVEVCQDLSDRFHHSPEENQ